MGEVEGLRERAKELSCLYAVNDVLAQALNPAAAFLEVAELLPSGWQWPEQTTARITHLGRYFQAVAFEPAPRRASTGSALSTATGVRGESMTPDPVSR